MNKHFVMVLLWLLNASASAAVVTFDTPSFPGSSGRIERYTENGIKLGGAFTHTDAGLAGNPFNGTAFIQYEGYSSLSIGTVSGARFNLVSIDIAELNINFAQPATVTFIAQRPGSVMVSQSFTIDGLIGEGHDFETFYFGSEFQGIEYAYIAEMPKDWISVYSFDNIRAEPVPLPAAAWLFVSGMLSLIRLGAKRKK
jgi:hypothetical protein